MGSPRPATCWEPRAEPQIEMGAGIAASPHCAERRICRCSVYLVPLPERFGTPLLDPGSPAQASLSIVQLSPKRSPDFYSTAPPEGSLVFRRPARLKTEVLALNRPMFRGPSWDNLSRVPLRSPKFRRTPGAASRDRKTISSGASSRLARVELESSSHSCRRRSVLLSLPRPCCPCGPFRGDWDFRPDHLKTMHLRSESRKQNFR